MEGEQFPRYNKNTIIALGYYFGAKILFTRQYNYNITVSCDKHSCGRRTDVWSTLAILVIEGLQLPASSIIAGSWSASDLQVWCR